VQVDLGEARVLDYVVVVPAVGPPGDDGPGYYFPSRFQVEIADRPDFTDTSIVAEINSATVSAHQPVVIPVEEKKARFVRVTATRLAGRDGRYFFALGELLAISGNRNLAAGCPVTASDSIENAPVWGVRYLVDGQGMVGPPLGAARSSTNGYHSAVSATPDVVKWVQIDLTEQYRLDEIRLVPARPNDFADRSGFGFPLRFKVEGASSPDFQAPQMLFDATASDYPNPGDGLLVIPTPNVAARYIRVTATKLWERTGDYVFALAELQVYARGQNVAHNAHVTALDSIERGLWAQQYLVDGFSSQHQLVEWPQWIHQEQQWAEWTAQQRAIEADWEVARMHAYNFLLQSIVTFAIGSFLMVTGVVWRARVVRKREAEKLREQIAHDLHDEVGSNLGSILLLAQSGDSKDLPEIRRITGQTAAVMRDLVWLMRGGVDTVADLFTKLREAAAILLIGIEYTFEVPGECATNRVSLEFKRQLFLAFKEILHNVVRHAGANRVTIRAFWDGGWLILEVKDNGKGFDLEQATAGIGLRSLRERATALRGELIVHTVLGKGTMVRLIVSIR
jgi:signal transduction histidine kinase